MLSHKQLTHWQQSRAVMMSGAICSFVVRRSILLRVLQAGGYDNRWDGSRPASRYESALASGLDGDLDEGESCRRPSAGACLEHSCKAWQAREPTQMSQCAAVYGAEPDSYNPFNAAGTDTQRGFATNTIFLKVRCSISLLCIAPYTYRVRTALQTAGCQCRCTAIS